MRWIFAALAGATVLLAGWWGMNRRAAMTVMAEPASSAAVAMCLTCETTAPEATSRPTVLIYHTHTHEAYAQGKIRYVETGAWRTADAAYNVVRVGDELQRILQEKYGIAVTHDITDHEPPKLGTAYIRSLATLQEYVQRQESFDLMIDLHRDAYSKGLAKNVAGQYAPLMLVVGNGEGFSAKWDWQQNLALAQRVTESLNQRVSGICREVRVKNGRYNQHISSGCMLVEVGHQENTLQEAMASMAPLAEVLAEILSARQENS